MNPFLKETANKSVIIANQKVELECLCSLVNEPTTTDEAPQQGVPTTELEDNEMDVDAAALNHVVENATYGLMELVTMPCLKSSKSHASSSSNTTTSRYTKNARFLVIPSH